MIGERGTTVNVFFTGKVAAGFDATKARVEEDMKVALGLFVSDYKLANLGNDEFMMSANVNDFEKMGEFISNPERMQWDKDNGAVYKGYTLSEMQG